MNNTVLDLFVTYYISSIRTSNCSWRQGLQPFGGEETRGVT